MTSTRSVLERRTNAARALSTDVQRTRLSIDVLGRYICNTLDEALASGPFDLIVVGSGMYGGFAAQEAAQRGLRVLVLEAGPFLVSEHVQNLAQIGLNVPEEIPPSHDPGTARNQVWGIPWRGNQSFPGLAFCVGGSNIEYLHGGGWQSTPHELTGFAPPWPRGWPFTFRPDDQHRPVDIKDPVPHHGSFG